MEAFFDLVKRVVESFGAFGLDYMFTGALAASYYGVPRTTMDVDVLVRVSREEARSKLVLALKQAGLLVDEKRIDAALMSGYRIATFEDSKSPYSVDVIFSSGKLEKRAGVVLGLPTFYQTPEDLISAKLRMIKATVPRERTLKDEDDVRAILRFTKVDMETVKEMAGRNNTVAILEEIVGSSPS
ncbi:MAG: hypothetical protein NWE85_03580 [Candidatus Bathyarchaeota archaeon]|nr:hypothetical protein [Candidatus Bathyarchaeota archaeon]